MTMLLLWLTCRLSGVSCVVAVLGRTVQETGVAPVDDGFTIITPGLHDLDQDGPAMVGDGALGFTGLRRYGGTLVNHVRLKIRTDLNLRDVMLVDSPGMIDSPVPSLGEDRSRDRGYDFTGVVRWFAERADVILLFFDPEKPGTTGETLEVMTRSLNGLDHKSHIVLNKVDQFAKVHDFARAYGSLCWNLSKVIPRKDLPRIYTMCVPTEMATPGLAEALPDLEIAREQILEEVHNAPMRRVDNSITRLYDASRRLHMHVRVMESIRKEMRSMSMKWNSMVAGAAASGLGLGAFLSLQGLWEAGLPIGMLGVGGAIGLGVYGNRHVKARADELVTKEGLYEVFQREHLMELAQGDDFILSLWDRVWPTLQVSVRTLGASNLPKVSSSELRGLEEVTNRYVPDLREAASRAADIVFDDSFAQREMDVSKTNKSMSFF